jgi:GR25 family glycosyltransferase involved in LPS biosynthesis
VYIIVSWPFYEGMKTTKPLKKMRPRPRPRPKVINTKPPLPITNLVIEDKEEEEDEEKGKGKGKGTKPEYESSLSNPSIQYYVIHVETNTFRDQNIIDQQETLGQPILVFDAVDGASFKGVRNIEDFLRKEYDPRIIDDYSPRKKHINEIACYMSHAMLVRSIADSAADYTVVFEDDFQILGGSNLHAKLQRILRTMEREDPDFDMIFLGTVNSGRGVSLADDIYHFNTSPGLIVYGAHGYVINNKNAKKIYGEMIEISDVVDVQYFNAMRKGRLRGYVVEPMLVRQQNEKFGTTVRL